MNTSFDFDSASDETYKFRFLTKDDNKKGFFDVLSDLTEAPFVEDEKFQEQLSKITLLGTVIIVCEEKETSTIVGTITLCIEPKFARGLASLGRVEDFVVLERMRGLKIGKRLMDLAVKYAKEVGCYKITLSGREDAVGFYQKFGFQKKSASMALYLE